MKKLIYLFLTVLIFACSSDASIDSSNNGVDYFFEVEFGGVVNRIKGNSSYEFPNQPSWILYNLCYGSTAYVQLGISDITQEDYVSGQNMKILMAFDNAQLGKNNGTLYSSSPAAVFPYYSGFYIEEYLKQLGVDNNALLGGFVENGPMSWTNGQSKKGKISNINITDLGTPSTMNGASIVATGTIKGTYNGVLYFPSSYGKDYDIPVSIRIEFNAVRYP